MEAVTNEIKWTDLDVVDIDEFIPEGEYNPHNIRPFLLHDHGFVLCVVFASHLQDALDAAVDANKLDHLQIAESEMDDYNDESLTYLGNAGEPFDIDTLSYIELKNPKFSFAALYNYDNS
jgi:hypothetical protein